MKPVWDGGVGWSTADVRRRCTTVSMMRSSESMTVRGRELAGSESRTLRLKRSVPTAIGT